MIGQTLGRYRITGKLGEGGMGVVFRARDDQLQRDLAIKLVSTSQLDDPLARARLLREARAAAALNHSNICTVYEVGESEGQVYIAMELVDGRPLSQHLESGPLPYAQALRFGIQLADAVSHAHARGIVHRDLKTLNVIVTPDGRCKVLDFGLARRLPDEKTDTSQTMLTEAGAVVGTPAYMAPEQLKGEAADARSDIWALGVMLYEMLAGVRPFSGKTFPETTAAILSRQPPALPARIPVALRAVVERCLEKAPARRFSDAAGLRAELDSIQQGIASSWPARFRQIRRRPVALLLSLLVLLLTLGIAFAPQSIRGRIAAWMAPGVESIAVLPLENRTGDPAQDYLADGITHGLINELDQFSSLKVVIGRTSVMRYKNTDKTPAEIASELNVQVLVEGSVSRLEDRIIADVRVIHPADGRTLGAVSRERPLRNFHQLQKEIVEGIARQLRVRMPEDLQRLQQIREVDPDVIEATLKGMAHWFKHTGEDIELARKYFEAALEKDPQYAPAYAGLMWVWTYQGSASVSPKEVVAGMERVQRRMREQGVAFDETQAEAYEGRANGEFYYEWNWEEAGTHYAKAIQMKPHSAELHLFYWDYLAAMNRMPEARAVIERALQLDPYNPFAQGQYGLYLLLDHTRDHRFDDAIAQFRKMLEGKMDFGLAHFGLWTAYHHKGSFPEAFAEAKASFGGDVPEFLELLDETYKKEGYPGTMRLLADLMASPSATYTLPTNIARLYAYAGDKDKALEYLRKALDEKDSGLPHLQVDPDWDDLRSDPRYLELLKEMKFPK